jgi:L-threonylcarbamoyladenylate synthase
VAERAASSAAPILPAHDPESLAAAAAALRSGGIVGLPTETVYGVGVLPWPAALQALIAAKQRPEEKGIALLIDDVAQVEDLVVVSAAARRLAASLWPGPLTLVLPLWRPGLVPAALSGGRETLAVRLPDHAVPRALARELGPLAVSSANRSGQPDALTAEELVAALGPSLSLVIDDGPVRGGVPSSVVAVGSDGRLSVLREGAVSQAAIEALLAAGA